MVHYFFLLDGQRFWERLRPDLGQCRLARSFAPCRMLCQEMLDRGLAGADSLIAQATRNLPFGTAVWQALAGELLAAGAVEVPRVPIEPTFLCALLAGGDRQSLPPREEFAPIQQALFGAATVNFGVGVYRPDHAGINHTDEVQRLAAYLGSLDPWAWRGDELRGTWPDLDEDLADARAWWPDLLAMYQHAGAHGWVVVCEEP